MLTIKCLPYINQLYSVLVKQHNTQYELVQSHSGITYLHVGEGKCTCARELIGCHQGIKSELWIASR